jgi:hypothetical protein
MRENRCVCCGEIIPEGRQVCPSCAGDVDPKVITNPVKAIRAFCMECSCGQTSEVKACPVYKCPLYPFRFGKNPYRQRREMTDEQKQVLADRLGEARKNVGGSVEKGEVDDG